MPYGPKVLELQEAMNRYGDASILNYRTLHPIGEAIISGFATSLGEGSETLGVPPSGDWRTDTGGYADAKFSTYWNRTLRVEAISMGLAVRIPHSKDDGGLWLRVKIELLIEGGSLTVSVGDGIPIKNIPLQYRPSDLEPVYEAIFNSMKSIFADPVKFAEASGRTKIGFLAI